MRRDCAPICMKRAHDIGTCARSAPRDMRKRGPDALLGGLGHGFPHPLIGEDDLVCQGSARLLGSHAAAF